VSGGDGGARAVLREAGELDGPGLRFGSGLGGGGCSMVFPKPSWQTDRGCPGRTVADMSAVADPATGVAMYHTFGVRAAPGSRPAGPACRRPSSPASTHWRGTRARCAPPRSVRAHRLVARRHQWRQRVLRRELPLHGHARLRWAVRSRDAKRQRRLL